ncbi:hypothetical protein HanRHA438_Chr04g0153071 [Helianthus annuus]|nr:hypothetical protein HanRHA438_Chr04g0153071 [Helianthus annuus]
MNVRTRVCDVARDTETKIKHVDSKNTRVVLPQPPRFHPKGTEFEVKNELCQNSSLPFSILEKHINKNRNSKWA